MTLSERIAAVERCYFCAEPWPCATRRETGAHAASPRQNARRAAGSPSTADGTPEWLRRGRTGQNKPSDRTGI